MKKTCITVITVVLVLMSIHTIVKAVTPIELQEKRNELKTKIDEAGKNIENIEVQLTENLEEINKLDEEIYNYEEQINTITENLAVVENNINEIEENLTEIQKKYIHQKEILEKRIVYMYEAGPTKYLDVLLHSKSIVDFISRYHLIAEISQYDKDLLDSIGKEKSEIEKIDKELKEKKQKLKEEKSEQKKLMISLENSKIVKNSYINKLTAEELKLKEDIELYQNQLDLVDVEILLTAMEGTSSEYVGGNFIWPAPGYYTITSKFGMRIHPVLKTYSMHSGMDIGTPMGSNAIAANAGIVTKSTYSYSYGNMVMIDHGGGISTLYAHGSELLKQVGDVVKQGDVIMKTGSTGWSTGPHLHFEIIVNGKAIDPYPYVVSNNIINE